MKKPLLLKPFLFAFIFLTSNFLLSQNLLAKETTIVVRVKARDAKFIGSSIGGAHIIIRDHLSKKILAEGLTEGSTGDTEKIMKQPLVRGQQLSDANTAFFKATLDIDKPTFISIEAFGPVNKKQATVRSSTQLWLIPGKDILGDGIVLEIPGFVVDILSPQTHETISAPSSPLTIKANVVLMCGCPVTPGGLWNAEDYEVKALISSNGKPVETVALSISEKASTFSAVITLKEGLYEIVVYAYDPTSGNTGVDKTNIIVSNSQ